jgi:DNA-binding transcriptional ArsR family regulator
MVFKMQAQALDRTFAALADPTRRAILTRLADGDALLKDLAEPFDMTLPAVAKHLRVLEEAGLITRTREAQTRPCRLEAKPLGEAAQWLDQYRRLWEQQFQRLDALLSRLQNEEEISNAKEGRDDEG